MKLHTRAIGAAVMIATLAVCIPANAAEEVPFTLTISGPAIVTVGEDFRVNVVLRNVSKRTILIEYGGDYATEVRDKDGKKLLPQRDGWDGSSAVISLKPGETCEELVQINGNYDLTKPGSYLVRVLRSADDNNAKSPIVKSNEITITVVPPLKSDGKQ